MSDAGIKIFEPHRARAEHLERAVTTLDKAGVRLAFPEHVHAAQTKWPQDCELSADQLRAELRALAAEVEELSRRARALHESLPEPAEFQLDDLDVAPESVYFILLSALSYIFEDGMSGTLRVIEKALAATPEAVRENWLKRQLGDEKLARLVAPAAGDRGVPRSEDSAMRKDSC